MPARVFDEEPVDVDRQQVGEPGWRGMCQPRQQELGQDELSLRARRLHAHAGGDFVLAEVAAPRGIEDHLAMRQHAADEQPVAAQLETREQGVSACLKASASISAELMFGTICPRCWKSASSGRPALTKARSQRVSRQVFVKYSLVSPMRRSASSTTHELQ